MKLNWKKQWVAEEIQAYAAKLRQTKELWEAKRLHQQIVDDGYGNNLFIQNMVVQMYGQCGHPAEARAMFDSLDTTNQFSWNILVAVHALNAELEEAKLLFDRAPGRDGVTWSTLLTGYAQGGHLQNAKEMFDKMPLSATVTWTSMFSEYALQGRLREARTMFEHMPHRDVVCWNAMVGAYAQNGQIVDAESTFDRMPLWTVASWNSLITAYSLKGDVRSAKAAFDSMPEQNTISWNALVSAYALNGHTLDAKWVFNTMPNRDDSSWFSIFSGYAQNGRLGDTKAIFDAMPHKNVISWTTLFQACALSGQLGSAKQVFDVMPQHDAISWTALLQGYAAAGDVAETRRLFQQMPNKTVISWNLVIGANAAVGDDTAALAAFRAMDLDGFQPDMVSYVSLLHAPLPLSACKVVHAAAIQGGFDSLSMVRTGLVATYGKCGSLAEASELFETMEERDLLAWDSIITSYARNGHGSESLAMFQRMSLEGVQPDGVYFISILSACSHGGLPADGRTFFVAMRADFDMEPLRDHYVCMVDVLGRAGRLPEAEELIQCMPFEPGVLAWRSLLHHASNLHGHKETAQRAAAQLESLDPEQSMPYVVLQRAAGERSVNSGQRSLTS